MADELIDIYDSEMNLLGTAMKLQANREGLWHKVFHCWILDNDQVWLQLRGKNKRFSPALLDITAAGHIGAGETAKQAGIREIEEELGLNVREDDLEKLFTYKMARDNENECLRVFNQVYVLKSRWRLSEIKMQPAEIDGIFTAKISDLIELFCGDVPQISIKGYMREPYGEIERHVGVDDFVPNGARYYLKVFSTLDRMS